MAFNIFKKKPASAEASAGKEAVKASAKDLEAKKTIRKTVSVSALSLPHITEKAAALGAQNQYVFKIVPGGTKHGVKNSVEAQYGVQVLKVNMITVLAKSIRVGRTMGKKPGYKKAIVTLKEGHKIEANV